MNLQGSGSVALVTNTSGIESSQNTISGNGSAPSAPGENLTAVFNNTLAQQLALLKQADSPTNAVLSAGQPVGVTSVVNATPSGGITLEANNFALPAMNTAIASAENLSGLTLSQALPQAQPVVLLETHTAESVAPPNTVAVDKNVTPVMHLTETLQQLKDIMTKLDGLDIQQTQVNQSTLADLSTLKQQVQESLQQVQQLLQQAQVPQGVSGVNQAQVFQGVSDVNQAQVLQTAELPLTQDLQLDVSNVSQVLTPKQNSKTAALPLTQDTQRDVTNVPQALTPTQNLQTTELPLTQGLQQDVSKVAQALTATQDALQKVEAALKQETLNVDQLPHISMLRQNFAVSEGKTLPTATKVNAAPENSDTLAELNTTLAELALALTQVTSANSKTTEVTSVTSNPVSPKKLRSDSDNVLLTTGIPAPIMPVQIDTPVTTPSGAGAHSESTSNDAFAGSAALELQNPKLSQLIDKSVNSSSVTQAITTQQGSAEAKSAGFVTPASTPNIGLNSSAVTQVLPDEIASSKQALNSLDSLSGLANAGADTAAKELSNRVASDMAQLGQQLPVESKVSVPPMTKHVYSAEWNQELGSKIAWMTSQNISSADIKLNPEHLGPISIRIDMQNDQANISFTAFNSGVKELLEASIPKLREMLGSQQLNLADVNVAQNAFSDQGQSSAQQNRPGQEGYRPPTQTQENLMHTAGEAEGVIDEVANQIEQSRAIVTQGIVSYYA